MDTLTHAMVGAAISDGWLRRKLGPIATPFALAAGALPDIDILTYFISPEYAWAHHRGYTHSFFIQMLAAPILGYVGYRVARKSGTWLQWSLLAFLCLFFHTILDLVTSWGTMPWLPFSNARVSWDVAPVLDLFIFALSGTSFVLNRLLRWERVDSFLNPLAYPVVHRHPRRQRMANWIGKVAVGLVAAYLLVGWQQNRQTVRIAERELAAAGVKTVEVRALPLMLTYISWGIVARDVDGTVHNAVYSSFAPKPMRFVSYPTAKGGAVDRARATPDGRLFAWYSQGMNVAAVEPDVSGSRITLQDRRFFTLGGTGRSRFVMEIAEGPGQEVTSVKSTQMRLDEVDMRDEARRLWNLTRYGQAEFAADAAVAAAGVY